MEARRIGAAVLAAFLWALLGANYRTPNFVIQTSDPRLAETFGKAAEKHRYDLAIAWTGKPMPNWSQPCPVTAHAAPHLAAGGATTFMFDRGEVYGWRMTIQGSAERIVDSVLPHEITHMVLASHFRCPVPRWADEGAASTVEHPSERAKHEQKLVEFLQTRRGIPFNRMVTMTEYPHDVMPLYAQGHSVVGFLVQNGGRQRFVAYLGEAMQSRQWAEATRTHYGIQDLGALQNAWLAWVAKGSPPLGPAAEPAGPGPATLVATAAPLARPEPNLIFRTQDRWAAPPVEGRLVPVDWDAPPREPPRVAGRQGGEAVSAGPAGLSGAIARLDQRGGGALPSSASGVHLSRPQPAGQPQQIILEGSWVGVQGSGFGVPGVQSRAVPAR